MAEQVTSIRRRVSRANSLGPREILSVLFRQRRLFFCSFLVIFLGFTLYAVLARSYTAEMKILLRRGRLDMPVSAGPSTAVLRYEVSDEEVNSEAELLRDRDTLRRVVVATGLDQNLAWRPRANSSEARLQRATHALARRLNVQPLRKTRLLRVTYESSDPEVATKVLQSVAAVYLGKHLAVHRPSGEFAFFTQQVEQHRARLTAALEELLQLNDRGAVEPALQRDVALQKLADAENSLRQLAVAISETEERIRALQQRLASLPERQTTQIRTADNPQLLEKMNSTLLTLQLRRTELLTRFQPEYRLVREIEEQIQQTQTAIEAEKRHPLRDETIGRNEQYEWAKSELEKSQVELQALQARFSAARVMVAEYASRTRQLGRDSLAREVLLRDSKAEEESYLLLLRKREEAGVGDALDQRGILNATVVQQPIAPAFPTHSVLSFAALGLLLGSLASTGIALASDSLDTTFRTPQEVSSFLEMPVLASVPAKIHCTKAESEVSA